MRAYECAGQREKLSLITSYYTVFSISPIIFNRNCRRNQESLVFPSSSSLITPHISKKLAVLQREIKASKFWYLVPGSIPAADIPPHPNAPGSIQITNSLDACFALGHPGITYIAFHRNLKHISVFCLTWGAIHSQEPAGKRWISASRLFMQVLWGQFICSQSCKSRTAHPDGYKLWISSVKQSNNAKRATVKFSTVICLYILNNIFQRKFSALVSHQKLSTIC